MPIRFSESGPAFPTELVDALVDGKVIFLCGAGVSAPHLPLFGALVDLVYQRLGVSPTPSEQNSIKEFRYEEALGSLARRLASPKRMYEIVAAELGSNNIDLTNHITLLRLSRDLENRIVLVTTNFDTLFERALTAKGHGLPESADSLAGQLIPAPGSHNFHGIIHLHGSLADKHVGVEASPLVLTSADYGDAYMRSGWASRFLFDLVRCRMLVLVGYRAGDAPLRYFFNVLEGDRSRFSDLQKVYAFDPGDGTLTRAKERWESVAVNPIPYNTAPSGHSVLWKDLTALADVIEKPSAWRINKANEIFSKSLDAASSEELDVVEWLTYGKRDVLHVLIKSVSDARWFDHLTSRSLWSSADAAWIIPCWCALRLEDQLSIDTAIAWHDRLGIPFGETLLARLASFPNLPSLYRKVWHLIARQACRKKPGNQNIFRILDRLKHKVANDADLHESIDFISPTYEISKNYRTDASGTHLSDLLHISLRVVDEGMLKDLAEAINKWPDPIRIAELALESLKHIIELGRDYELITNDYDAISARLPSVARHSQNDYDDGVSRLTMLVTDIFDEMSTKDTRLAARLAYSWKNLNSLLGDRLWLYALASTHVFKAEFVFQQILQLDSHAFWSIKLELVMAIERRSPTTDSTLRTKYVKRVLNEGPRQFSHVGDSESDKVDWKSRAIASSMWLRLSALRKANVITREGQTALTKLESQYQFLAKPYEEQDLFDSYFSGVSWVTGNPTELLTSAPQDRLALAKKEAYAFDPDKQHNWMSYCLTDLPGAFDLLIKSRLIKAHATLWRDLINAIVSKRIRGEDSFNPDQSNNICLAIFQRMGSARDSFIQEILTPLSELFSGTNFRTNDSWSSTWGHLWKIAELEREQIEESELDKFLDKAINRAAGRLTESLLRKIDSDKKNRSKIDPKLAKSLKKIYSSKTVAGWFGRATLVRQAHFILQYDFLQSRKALRRILSENNSESISYRSILVRYANVHPRVTRHFSKEIFLGAIENQTSDNGSLGIAFKLVLPLVNDRITNGTNNWGIRSDDVRDVLTRVSNKVLVGVAQCFERLLHGADDRSWLWTNGISEVFRDVWPKDRSFLSKDTSMQLAQLAVMTEQSFPQAFETLAPYLIPVETDWFGAYFIQSSGVAASHPECTLRLLWILVGPGSSARSTEIGGVLDAISQSKPELLLDRRFQWLEQRAVRI